MEPLAPGTEDEMVDFKSLTKQETENERLLSQKAWLKNGRFEHVFEYSYTNGVEQWYCRVCECPVMGKVYQHELGRRHTQNVSSNSQREPKEDESRKRESTEDSATLEIAPGEPVPPGFEGEINRRAQIQERLDGFKVGPLVALEYLIEMQDYDPSKEPSYLCILCDKKGDPRTVLTHLASYNHISQYLQKHFPTCYRALAPYMTKQYKRNWQGILQKVAEAIEKTFGRLRPFSIDQDKFEKDRLHYLSMISKGRHFSEQNGPTFLELVKHEELTKTFDDEGRLIKTASSFGGKAFIEREPVKVPSKRSPSPPFVARPTKRARPPGEEPRTGRVPASTKTSTGDPRPRQRSLSSLSSLSSDEELKGGVRRMARNRSPPRNIRGGGRRQFDHRDDKGAGRRRSPSPRRRIGKDHEEERRRNREKERIQKVGEFQKLSKAIENDIEKTMKQYEKNPEKHPKYNEEWKLFWNRRYKELQAEGKDASKYDFKPEWIEFWGKRMRELSDEDLKNRKDGLRKRLGLAEEAAPIKFRIGGGPVESNPSNSSQPTENRPNLPMAARPDNDPEIILLDDKDDVSPPRRVTTNRNRGRSHSPWESDTSPPRTTSKGRRSSPSPGPDKRRLNRPIIRSRDRSFERNRPMDNKRSPDRGRRSPDRSRRSAERLRRSPERLRRSPERSRRSPDRSRRSPDRSRRSPDRSRRSPDRSRRSPRSPDRSRRSPDRLRRSRSRDLPLRISKERSLKRSPGMSRDNWNRRSRTPDSYQGGKNFPRDRERDYFRERDIRDHELDIRPPRERSWERGMRESSFERDMRGKDRIRTVADLPWERENMYPPTRMMPHDDFYPPPHVMRQPQHLNFVPPPAVDEEPDNGEVNIVSVLRLLTALEERLGSLGPKIIDLLAQALALEKKEANSSETLLDNEINCVMFETVKEKLKGQLLAGFVDPMQDRAFKKAIQKTASLIHLASQRKKERIVPEQIAVAVPGVGAVDKAAIAKQLANALVAQGKTDVTQAELEQLINAVVGMAEASKGSNKPMTTSSFLSQLSGGPSNSNNEKIIIPRVKPSEEKLDKKDILADLDTEPLSPSTPEKSTTSNMENLSDSDLQTLLQNFKDLSTEEQMNLINYLKKMELDEPDRVERLRKFVNLGGDKSSKEIIELDKDPSPSRNGRQSPFSSRIEEANPDSDSFDRRKKEEKVVKIHLDSEDEDYSYEDVVKAASKNLKQQEMEDNRKIVEDSIVFSSAQKETNLTDAKTLISNLMSSLSSSSASSVMNLLGLPSSTTTSASINNVTTPTSSAQFAHALSSINIDGLASIVSNVQQQKTNQEKMTVNFEAPVENRERVSPAETRLPNPLATDKGSLIFEPPRSNHGPMTSGPMGGGTTGAGPTGPGPVGPLGPLLQINPGQDRMGGPMRPMGSSLMGPGPGGLMGPGPGGPMNMGPRNSQQMRFPQRGPVPNQFGNSNFTGQRTSRPHFNPNFNNNPRFGGPRGSGFNNRW